MDASLTSPGSSVGRSKYARRETFKLYAGEEFLHARGGVSHPFCNRTPEFPPRPQSVNGNSGDAAGSDRRRGAHTSPYATSRTLPRVAPVYFGASSSSSASLT